MLAFVRFLLKFRNNFAYNWEFNYLGFCCSSVIVL